MLNSSTAFSRDQRFTASMIADGDPAYMREMQMLPGTMAEIMFMTIYENKNLDHVSEWFRVPVETIEFVIKIGLDEIQSLMKS